MSDADNITDRRPPASELANDPSPTREAPPEPVSDDIGSMKHAEIAAGTTAAPSLAVSHELPKEGVAKKTSLDPVASAPVQPSHPSEGADDERTVHADVAKPMLIAAKPGAEEQTERASQMAAETSVDATDKENEMAREVVNTTEEPWTQQQMEAKYGPTLMGDMNDAELMLSYATRNGLEDEKKLTVGMIKALIVGRHRFRCGIFSCENEEAQFRTNYGLLAQAILPVTVASLRDSLPNGQQRRWLFFREVESRSNAERSCFQYRNRALLVLIMLLVSQVYWTICSSLLNKVDLPGISPEKPKVAATVDTTPKSVEQLEGEQNRAEIAAVSLRGNPLADRFLDLERDTRPASC